MNLDEFISESLKGIFKGVKDAQDFAKENGGRVNPIYFSTNAINKKNDFVKIESNEGSTMVTEIDFDIAVTASDKKESGISGGISVLSLKFGGKTDGEKYNETVSRIKFSIAVALPSTLPYTPVGSKS
jgi:hypothetical protein